MNDNELCDKSTGNADICAGLRTLSGQAEWSTMPNGDLVRYAGIGEDGAMLVDVVRARPVENITVTVSAERIDPPLRGRPGLIDLLAKAGGSLPELDPPITDAASQTPETDAIWEKHSGTNAELAIEAIEKCGLLERERNEARRLFESSKRARKSLSEACDLLQRQLAESRKQLRWKQYRVEVLQRVGRKIVVERDEALDALAKQLNYANDAREQRDKLADTLNDLWHHYSLTGAAYDLIEASLAAVKAVPGVEETTPPTRPQFPDNQIVTVGPV